MPFLGKIKSRLERKLLKKFDVIVVGAGTGGCLAAKTLAKPDLKSA